MFLIVFYTPLILQKLRKGVDFVTRSTIEKFGIIPVFLFSLLAIDSSRR